MVFQHVLSGGLTVQSFATIIFGSASLTTKYILNTQTCLTKLADISLRSNTMSVSSLFPPTFQISRSTGGSRLQCLVCVPLVSNKANLLSSLRTGSDLTRTRGFQGDTRGRSRTLFEGMVMSYASLPTNLSSSPRKRSLVIDPIWTSQ